MRVPLSCVSACERLLHGERVIRPIPAWGSSHWPYCCVRGSNTHLPPTISPAAKVFEQMLFSLQTPLRHDSRVTQDYADLIHILSSAHQANPQREGQLAADHPFSRDDCES